MLKVVQSIKQLVTNERKVAAKKHGNLLSSQNEFHRNLRLERERSNRSGLPFSILVFESKNTIENQDDIQFMQAYLIERLRATDSFGRLDNDHIGIILFNTSSEGAKVLARDIHSKFMSAQRRPPETKVFVYPDEAPKITTYSKDFHNALKLERERSDRSGLPFSILIFDLSKSEKYQENVELMKAYLSKRLRATDSMGWIDENNIGVTMFNSLLDGAKVLAGDVCDMFINETKKPPGIRLLIYQGGDLKVITYGKEDNIEQIDFAKRSHNVSINNDKI